MERFPKQLQDFASVFRELQVKRHSADYDPNSRFSRNEVLSMIDTAAELINGLESVDSKDLGAFAVWSTMVKRKD